MSKSIGAYYERNFISNLKRMTNNSVVLRIAGSLNFDTALLYKDKAYLFEVKRVSNESFSFSGSRLLSQVQSARDSMVETGIPVYYAVYYRDVNGLMIYPLDVLTDKLDSGSSKIIRANEGMSLSHFIKSIENVDR